MGIDGWVASSALKIVKIHIRTDVPEVMALVCFELNNDVAGRA